MKIRHEHFATTASIFAVLLSGFSIFVAQQALRSTERISVESQRVALFAQFQDHYNAVSSRFPARVLDPKFRPSPGSEDFVRLEAYWFFCFSEWYETNRVNKKAFGDLWTNYYTPLIADGLEIPSLRYVLERRVRLRGPGRGAWNTYLKELAKIAHQDGNPLADDVVAILEGRLQIKQPPSQPT